MEEIKVTELGAVNGKNNDEEIVTVIVVDVEKLDEDGEVVMERLLMR
jgi:hypothetical protein